MEQSTVTISAAMLNCLKQYILSTTNGVDLTPIVEDLGGDDSTAIAVALAYKGIKPEIDTTTRFEYEYRDTYSKQEFKSYSIIKDAVLINKTYFSWDNDTHTWKEAHSQEISIALYNWLNKPTSEEAVKSKILANYNPVGKESKTVLRTSPKN